MSPTILENDYVFSWSWFKTRYKKDQIVLVRHPKYQLIIKRILDIRENGDCLLKGDNKHSSMDSEKLGWQKQSNIIGKVFFLIKDKSKR